MNIPIMTSKAEEADMMVCCASCGKAEVDNVTLSKCSACKSVRYCGVTCQRNHRPKHKRDCKKRAAALRDEILFRQPESSHLGDCPICLLPLDLDLKKATLMTCCSELICNGCLIAHFIHEKEEMLERACPICRLEEDGANEMRRLQANDPVAMREMGKRRYDEGDYGSAFDCWTKAAGSGDVVAHYQLSTMYHFGKGVEKDKKKELFHLEEAAIGGHSNARYYLGWEDWGEDRTERAVKHFIIAAKLGHDESIQKLVKFYAKGIVTKEDLAEALRAHQAAVDATKSLQREAVAAMVAHTSRTAEEVEVCASCGIAEVECQRDCKKRADELRDEILFKQPESSHLGDCPICFLPLSPQNNKTAISTCCSKMICDGCIHAYREGEGDEMLRNSCLFCRQHTQTQEQADANRMRRVEANDPVAIRVVGMIRYREEDFEVAHEYLTKAAGLGDLEAHYQLSLLYNFGHGVEVDIKKEAYHLEEAAIGGHSNARHNLGCVELDFGRKERAVKHFIIAANLGNEKSIEKLMKFYVEGLICKQDFDEALLGYQAAVDATKSPQREAAAAEEEEARKN